MTLEFKKAHSNAVIPTRAGPNEVGYDLTLISVDKKISDWTTRYDTGIIVKPPEGYHTEIVPRSSLSKTGYMMSNSVGVIDQTYRGHLMVVLTRVDPTLPPLTLPYKGFQLVVRKTHLLPTEEMTEMDETYRGAGGFGSTDT